MEVLDLSERAFEMEGGVVKIRRRLAEDLEGEDPSSRQPCYWYGRREAHGCRALRNDGALGNCGSLCLPRFQAVELAEYCDLSTTRDSSSLVKYLRW